MIKAAIIDDESHAIDMAKKQLERSSYEIDISAVFQKPVEASQFAEWNELDLVFVDVQMPQMNGFELLEQIGPMRPKTIFCTAHDAYAVKALQMGALDYLLKPMDLEDLNRALGRYTQQLKTIVKTVVKPELEKRICVPATHGYQMVELSELIWLQSSNNYTYLHMAGAEQPVLISKTLKTFENRLLPDRFVRVNQSAIIGVDYIAQFDRRDGMSVFLKNGKEIPVSATYKTRVQEVIERFLI